MADFSTSPIPVANVMQVPARSPLRYPGGKLWLVPHIRHWLQKVPAQTLYEPFVGGGNVSLTAVAERLVERAVMVELDEDVAALWRASLHYGMALMGLVEEFDPTMRSVQEIAEARPTDVVGRGFRTLVLNRTRYAGILQGGAGSLRRGDGKGIASRWYRDTLLERLAELSEHSDRLHFTEGDGLEMLDEVVEFWGPSKTAVFADPPYTAGGKMAGRRLYKHNEVDHGALFSRLARSDVSFLMTYDVSDEVVDLVARHDFTAVTVQPRTAHHRTVPELLITRESVFT